MIRIKKLLQLIIFLPVFISCKKNFSIPVSSCAAEQQDSSLANPKNNAYHDLLKNYVERGVPGIVLLVQTPKEGLWMGAAGKSKIETDEPMLPCNIHHSGSVVKMYIGTAIMLLGEDGKISLDDPMNKYVDADICNHIGNGNKATVRQLMNHTSGIPDFIPQTAHITDYFNNLFNHYTTIDYLHYIYGKDADFEPGEKTAYCNTNYVLLTLIIDKITGKPHGDFLSERIFKKLGLTQTFYKSEPGYPRPAGLVNSYFDRYGNGSLENITEPAIHFDEISVGHDGMLASVHDYGKFLEALLKGKIVSQESLNQMQVWRYDQEAEVYNGLSLLKLETKYGSAIGHGGGNLGVAMEALYYPKDNITIVLCGNISGYFASPSLDILKHLKNDVEEIAFK